jgi:hypothetical protein
VSRFDEIFDLERLRELWKLKEEGEPEPEAPPPPRPRVLDAHAELAAAIRRRLGVYAAKLEPLIERARVLLVEQTGWVEPEKDEAEEPPGPETPKEMIERKRREKKEKKEKEAEKQGKKDAKKDDAKKDDAKKGGAQEEPESVVSAWDTLATAGAAIGGAGASGLGAVLVGASSLGQTKDNIEGRIEPYVTKPPLKGEELDLNKQTLAYVLQLLEDGYEALARMPVR